MFAPKYLELPPGAIGDVTGNASRATKALWLLHVCSTGGGFGVRTGKSLKLVEISILPKADEPKRQEARVVLEMPVTEDMLNLGGNVHGACITYLIDICSTLPIIALLHAQGGSGDPGVSQQIDTIFHAPASLGDELKLITTSTTVGGRTTSARIDLWDTTHRRLVASGTQGKMEASKSKL
ncbi:HotDog domain-containing protein [Pisolithus croceorrhizus]|nr:HotDog domain-containing protein [Pisolithus croceorrhizus]